MIRCPKCGFLNEQVINFCGKCASPLAPSAKTSTSVASKNTLIIVAVIIGTMAVLCVSCGLIGLIQEKLNPPESATSTNSKSEPDTSANKPVTNNEVAAPTINIPDLATKSALEVDAILGKPSEITPIKKSTYKDHMPGEYRDYKLEGIGTISIRFFKARPATLRFESPTPLADTKIAKRVGFDLSALENVSSNTVQSLYSGTAGGVEFDRVQIVRTSDGKSFNILQAELASEKSREEKAILGEMPKESSYDGRVQPVVDFLKENLNDYDSSEFVRWFPVVKTTYEGKPAWGIKMQLRAKNAFGAYALKTPFFYIRQNRVVGVEGLND